MLVVEFKRTNSIRTDNAYHYFFFWVDLFVDNVLTLNNCWTRIDGFCNKFIAVWWAVEENGPCTILNIQM